MSDSLPSYLELFNPLLSALRDLGGSARPREAQAAITESLGLSDDQLEVETETGANKLYNRIAWARFYLASTGFIDSSKRGVWALSEKGTECGTLSEQEIQAIRKEVQAKTSESAGESPEKEEEAPEMDADPPGRDYREEVRDRLRAMSPSGFERFCQRLLREAGFESVTVTGRSGDGGIDGQGLLRVNPMVSFSVIFQSKRYSSPVGAPQIRDFRGAMSGRADRGLFITTSSFTRDAIREASRDGATQIELIDVDGITDLLEQLELGLEPVQSFKVRPDFFEPYLD